ncbi:hypothetical protein BN1723_020928, partial [Verticillium longisporum]
SQ